MRCVYLLEPPHDHSKTTEYVHRKSAIIVLDYNVLSAHKAIFSAQVSCTKELYNFSHYSMSRQQPTQYHQYKNEVVNVAVVVLSFDVISLSI